MQKIYSKKISEKMTNIKFRVVIISEGGEKEIEMGWDTGNSNDLC